MQTTAATAVATSMMSTPVTLPWENSFPNGPRATSAPASLAATTNSNNAQTRRCRVRNTRWASEKADVTIMYTARPMRASDVETTSIITAVENVASTAELSWSRATS